MDCAIDQQPIHKYRMSLFYEREEKKRRKWRKKTKRCDADDVNGLRARIRCVLSVYIFFLFKFTQWKCSHWRSIGVRVCVCLTTIDDDGYGDEFITAEHVINNIHAIERCLHFCQMCDNSIFLSLEREHVNKYGDNPLPGAFVSRPICFALMWCARNEMNTNTALAHYLMQNA